MFYALDKNNIKVHIGDTKDGEFYFCQICNQKLKLVSEHQRQGNKISEHFSHIGQPNAYDKVYTPCTDTWHYCKSEWHRAWQSMFPQSCQECVVSNGIEKHIADVLINDTVVEFQHSRISIDEFRERNKFYSSCGYDVIWVFDLSEEIDTGEIKIDRYDHSKLYWRSVPKFFRQIRLNDEQATIILQFFDFNEENIPVMIMLKGVYKEFSEFYAKQYYSTKEFVEQVVNGTFLIDIKKKRLLEEVKKKQLEEISDGYTILELWDNAYFRMAVANKMTGQEMIVEGDKGNIKRKYGKIIGRYSNKLKSGEYQYSPKFYCVSDAELPIWELKRYWERRDNEYMAQRVDDTLSQYNDCNTLTELILKNKTNNFVVECLYNNQIYILNFVDEIHYNAVEFDPNSGEILSSGCENYFVYPFRNKKIWKQYLGE